VAPPRVPSVDRRVRATTGRSGRSSTSSLSTMSVADQAMMIAAKRLDRQILLARRSASFRRLLSVGDAHRNAVRAAAIAAALDTTNATDVKRGTSTQFKNAMFAVINPEPDSLTASSRRTLIQTSGNAIPIRPEAVYLDAKNIRQFGAEPLNLYYSLASTTAVGGGARSKKLKIYERDVMRRRTRVLQMSANTEAARERVTEARRKAPDGSMRAGEYRRERRPDVPRDLRQEEEEAKQSYDPDYASASGDDSQEEERSEMRASIASRDRARSRAYALATGVGHQRVRSLAARSAPLSSASAAAAAALRDNLSLLTPAMRAEQFSQLRGVSTGKRIDIADIDSSAILGTFKYLTWDT
jgi:hypothetical protein